MIVELAVAALVPVLQDGGEALARKWVDAVRRVNEDHAGKPGKVKEPELAKRIPKDALVTLDRLLAHPNVSTGALMDAGEACLDLDLMREFEKVRARLVKLSGERAFDLGTALSRDRYILRGIGGLDRAYLERFAVVMDAVLGAYDELFGFEEWSKVPGKKLRVRIYLGEEIKSPPQFAPQFPFHSQIDFPVIDAKELKSPTSKGHFLFYGLCHELGHVIAMWGDREYEADYHAWAHYTGVAIVEHLSKGPRKLEGLLDVMWRSLEKERQACKDKAPSLAHCEGVIALLVALHDRVGSKAIGAAINLLDREDQRLRINKVRYYRFGDLKEALLKTVKDPKARAAVAELIP